MISNVDLGSVAIATQSTSFNYPTTSATNPSSTSPPIDTPTTSSPTEPCASSFSTNSPTTTLPAEPPPTYPRSTSPPTDHPTTSLPTDPLTPSLPTEPHPSLTSHSPTSPQANSSSSSHPTDHISPYLSRSPPSLSTESLTFSNPTDPHPPSHPTGPSLAPILTSTDHPSISPQSTKPRALKATDLPALMTVLGDSSHLAFQLGIQIGVSLELVRTLEQKALKDPVKFLSLVLGERMENRSSPLTLKTLVDALYKSPIHNEALALKLQQHFDNMSSTGPEQPLTNLSGVPMSPAMAAYSEFLDSVYQVATIPPDPKGGPEPSTKYTNLAVIKKEKVSHADADKFTKATLCGGIDESTYEKKAIELEDIFKPEEGQAKVEFVLAEGAPGIGKSTMVWELCRRRHKIEATEAFIAVVLLRLCEKEVQEAESIADLLYHDDPKIKEAIVQEVSSTSGENILFILDGFDEVPHKIRKSMFLAKIIKGQRLIKATILVTSRPSARADLLSLRKPDKHMLVLGFTHKLIEQYASSIFGFGTPLLADFLKYVSINPAIKSMMYVPLNCAIVSEVYQENREEGRPIPQTMTQLYCELTLSRINRHLNEGGHLVTLPEKLGDLVQEYPEVHRQLVNLAELAFSGTLKQEVIFNRLPAGCSTLGLMTVSQHLYVRGKSTTNFFHLTMQEFLAAFHISQLPHSEQKEVFECCSDGTAYQSEREFSHMDVVWRFVAGLTGFEGIGWELVQSRNNLQFERDHTIMSPFLFECVYEAQEKASCNSVVSLVTSPLSVHTSSTFASYALGYCIAVSTCSWRVRLVGSPGTLEMLVYGLRSQEAVCGFIDSLDLEWMPNLRQDDMAHLSKLPGRILQQLSHLTLKNCRLGHPELDILADAVVTMTNLTHFSISCHTSVTTYWNSTTTGDGDNNTTDGDSTTTEGGDMVKLLHTLQKLAAHRRLHNVCMKGVPVDHKDIQSLSRLIAPPGGLRELAIGGYRIERDCVEHLLKTVLPLSSLQTLTVHRMNMDTTSLLFKPLMVNHNIRKLVIESSIITISFFFTCIAEVLRVNTTVERLIFITEDIIIPEHIRSTSGVSDGVRDLADAIKVNQSLKQLSLNGDTTEFLSVEEVRTLVGALQYNQTLEKLTLARTSDCFSPEQRKALDPRVSTQSSCVL